MATMVSDYTALISGYSWIGNKGDPYLTAVGKPAIITYSFASTAPSYLDAGYGFTPEAVASYSAFTSTQMDLARQALAAWADVCGVIFIEAPAGTGDIQFGNVDFAATNLTGSSAAWQPYLSTTYQRAIGGDVFYNKAALNADAATMEHELLRDVGLALGLKAPNSGSTVLSSGLDNWSYTVLSNNAKGSGTSLGTLDIQAAQYIYGPQSGDGTGVPAWNWDAASATLTQTGNDSANTIRGVYGNNVIDGGAGNDRIIGGFLSNTLIGGAGKDTISVMNGTGIIDGGDGDDTITVSQGRYRITGGAGNDILSGGAGYDTAVFSGARELYTVTKTGVGTMSLKVTGPDGTDTLTNIERLAFADQTVVLKSPKADFNDDCYSDILWQNDNGQAAIWTMNGFAQLGGSPVGGNPGPAWHVVGSGDFFGDGKADILWQNDDGSTVIWTMDGMTQTGSSYIGSNPGPSWHVKATNDFNGDGKADILWQNDNGQAAIWEMDGLTVIAGSYVGGNPGPTWHVVGSGDFNGDAKADIVWQNDSGQAAIWTMDGLTQTGSYFVGGNPGPTWHVKGVGDFYGIRESEILWQNDNGQVVMWSMSHTNQTGSYFIGGNPGPAWDIVGTGDYNGDGCTDILWRNDNGQAAVWTMTGNSQLGGSLVGGNPGTTWHIPSGVG